MAIALAVGATAIVGVALRSRARSRRSFLRDSESGARSLGVDIMRTKLLVWVVAAFRTGATGAVVLVNSPSVRADSVFSVLRWPAVVIFIAVIGGVGNTTGPIIGVLVFWFLDEQLSDAESWCFIILGSVAAVMVIVAPRGAYGLMRDADHCSFSRCDDVSSAQEWRMPDMTQPVFIVDAVRTPVGKIGGGLAHVRPDDLAAAVIRALIERTPELEPARVDDVHFGNGNGAGEENRNVGRMAALLAGLPTSVPGVTENRLCGSGLEAIAAASRQVATGDADVCIAGGVESMSRAPWVVTKPDRPYERAHQTMHSTTLGWRLVNPAMRNEWTVPLGEGAEILAERYEIGRPVQDAFALRSHQRAAAAWRSDRFADEVTAVPGAELDRDESVREDSSPEALARLRPVFRSDGTVTAGNSSPMNDAAAALLLASERAVEEMGRDPLARVAARAVSGVDPHLYGLGPVTAASRALERAGITWRDLTAVELNEAFASQALACLSEWPDLDRAIVNPNGGAIAIGHPIGCSGARIMTTLVHELRRRGGGWGLATMCIGVGQGIAVVVQST